jgi:hypothetical protein
MVYVKEICLGRIEWSVERVWDRKYPFGLRPVEGVSKLTASGMFFQRAGP